MPDEVQVEHQRWVGASVRLDSLHRGRTLAMAMLAAGDDTELIEPQLVALGLSAPTAAQVTEIVRTELIQRIEPIHTMNVVPQERNDVMKILSNGQVSLPASTRKRWNAERVLVVIEATTSS